MKIVIKSEENRDGGDDVGVLFTWSVHTSNMVINAKIMRKSGKKSGKMKRQM